jgi:hypothetical protein
MTKLRKLFRWSKARARQRGSAMLAALMVIVGLSLLGLAFVSLSETEGAISVNQRNHSQTVAAAEAGARLVVQWFQYPDKMRTLGLMPANATTIKTNRVIPGYTGYYKPDTSDLLCDLPYGPDEMDKFYGAEDSPDILITQANASTFLQDLNTKVFGAEGALDARAGGEITEIRIFAPPMVGATLAPAAAPHFYQGGTRYGLATIMVKANKYNRALATGNRESIAQAEVRIVVSQFPTPQPAGPLQAQTALATNGNFNVHWGLVSSQQALDIQKDYTTIPWFNAYERIHFNRGYDSSVLWAPGLTVRAGDVVRPTAAAITANPLIRYREYTVSTSGVIPAAATEPTWPNTSGGTVTLDGITYVERASTTYPLTSGGGANASNTAWLYYIARGDVSVEDPWFHVRSAQNLIGSPNNNPQPYAFPYANPTSYQFTHHFQFQSFDQYPNYKTQLFPIFSYDYWKSAALAGNGQDGVKYLRWVASDTYSDGITTKTFRDWAESTPGFYFFDSKDSQNPQTQAKVSPGGGKGPVPINLAPDISINGGGSYMSTFIYLNASFDTTGLSGPAGNFNQPGEPYMDIGHRKVLEAASGGLGVGDYDRDAAGAPIITGAVNGRWDYQDLSWSNTGAVGGGTKNDTFDVRIESRVVHDPSNADPASTYTGWFPVPYKPGCFPGDNACVPCNCSEPHEPYLNLKYRGDKTLPVTVGWFDPTSAITAIAPAIGQRVPKKTTNSLRTGTPVTCSAASTQAECTSNAYDRDGGLVILEPATDGVLYVEGNWTSTGNADYYGSVLVGSEVDAKGTPNIWFDESLTRGIRLTGFPRVMITSVETDK